MKFISIQVSGNKKHGLVNQHVQKCIHRLLIQNRLYLMLLQKHSYAYTQEELEFEIVSICFNTGLIVK